MAAKITKWTDEVINFMIENYEGRDNIELAELLNEKFNLNTNGDRVSNVKSNLKRRKGIDITTGINRGCIKKGNIPFNKGLKWNQYLTKEQQEKSSKTWFKKGNIPMTAVEIGEEHIRHKKPNDEGFLCVKTCNGKGNKNWTPKQRYVYEQHYGEIPKGHKVIFADGNRNNFDISNLILVSNAEELHLNKRGLRFKDKELTETGLNVVKVILKLGGKNERSKSRKSK